MEHFSDKKLHQLKEVFALYDTHGFGLVHVDHLATMIRLMGVNPTEEELKELTETEVELYENQIDFPTFIELLTRHFCIGKAEEDLHKAFQVFDREDSGIISENELRYALTNLGNVMSLSEVDDLLDGVRIGPQGSVSYSSLVNKLDE